MSDNKKPPNPNQVKKTEDEMVPKKECESTQKKDDTMKKTRHSKMIIAPEKTNEPLADEKRQYDERRGSIFQNTQNRRSRMEMVPEKKEETTDDEKKVKDVRRGSSIQRMKDDQGQSTTSNEDFRPIEKLRSTNNSSSTSTFSNGKMEVLGNFTGKDVLNVLRTVANVIKIYKLGNGVLHYMNQLEFKNQPLYMALIKNSKHEPNLVVVCAKTFELSIHKVKDGIVIEAHNKKIGTDTNDPLPRIFAANESTHSLLAIQVHRSSITTVSFAKEKPIQFNHKISEPQTIQNMCWLDNGDNTSKLVFARRGNIGQDKRILYYLADYNLNTNYMSDRILYNVIIHPGMLIQVAAPMNGIFVLGYNYLSYVKNERVVTGTHSLLKKATYTSFGSLSDNKFLFLTGDNQLLLTRLVTENEQSEKVIYLHTQKIKTEFIAKRFLIIDEFQILLQMEDGEWKYGTLKRIPPGVKYHLEIGNTSPNDDKVRSPPLISGLGEPKAVSKRVCPENSDSVKAEKQKQTQQFPRLDLSEKTVIVNRYTLKKLIGSGAFGKVFQVEDNQEKDTPKVLKVVEPNQKQSFFKEVAALNMLKPLSGVVKLLGYFEFRYHYFIVLPDCGEPIVNPLKRKSPRSFSLSNVIFIGYFLVKTMIQIHKIGILHQDMHICNVLINCKKNGKANLKIIDFGLAESVTDLQSEETVQEGKKQDFKECAKIIVEISNKSHSFTFFKQENTFFNKVDESNRWIDHFCQTIHKAGVSAEEILDCFSREYTSIQRPTEIEFKMVKSDGKDVLVIM